MRYRVTGINIEHSPEIYNSINGSVNMPGQMSKEIKVDLLIEEYNSSEVRTLDDFERALKGNGYTWLTDDMLYKALKNEYPERFL